MLRHYLRLARPLDWLKNGFVPLGLLFAEAWSSAATVTAVAIATAAFCLAASAAYAFNDVADAPADRLHAQKRLRPVAAGQIAPAAALVFGGALAIAALAVAASVGWVLAGIVAAYLALNVAYSRLLRRIPVLDVAAIAAGFMLRVLAGTLGVGIPPSQWLLATTLALALFLAFAKRRAESRTPTPGATRRALATYPPNLLDYATLASAAAAAALYAGFTLDGESIRWHAAPLLWITAPPAIGVLARYAWLVFRRGCGENPARDLAGDPPIALLSAAWLALTVLVTGGYA